MHSDSKTRVILITDGDKVAQTVVEEIAVSLGLRCISASAGNPTPINGKEIVNLIKRVPYDPVLVMFDDRGSRYKGPGEMALEYVANHPDIEVLGVVAVASNTNCDEGIKADFCVNKQGVNVNNAVDKYGSVKSTGKPVIRGDTVDVLNNVDVPVIVGIGDIGKMDRKDDIMRGAPITKKAIIEILERSGALYGRTRSDSCQHRK